MFYDQNSGITEVCVDSSEQELTEEVTATTALEEDMSGELIMDHVAIKKEQHGK